MDRYNEVKDLSFLSPEFKQFQSELQQQSCGEVNEEMVYCCGHDEKPSTFDSLTTSFGKIFDHEFIMKSPKFWYFREKCGLLTRHMVALKTLKTDNYSEAHTIY